MITITIPEWLLWLAEIWIIADLINKCMKIYLWWLKRKINRLQTKSKYVK